MYTPFELNRPELRSDALNVLKRLNDKIRDLSYGMASSMDNIDAYRVIANEIDRLKNEKRIIELLLSETEDNHFEASESI